ncbi:uncharacterized protein LOC120003212 [Tripterygium wilfordii]|uniref:uncharacterized protein LOC120003212 n=1 Tax=Tripterygium wilfordii TaxID=458696 RepID=UPI0018F8638A|nr:uncharacterized protein LOC120003212 [Tripterygium wilfordii]
MRFDSILFSSFADQWWFLFCFVFEFRAQGPKQVLWTGEVPPIGNGCTTDSVYQAGFELFFCQNENYCKRFPQDIEIVREIIQYLAELEGGNSSIRGHLDSKRTARVMDCTTTCLRASGDPILVPGAPRRISHYFLNAVR